MTPRFLHAMTLFALFIALTSMPTSAQAPLPDVAEFGPQVGERVPTFSLIDQFGQRHDLESLMGPNGLWLEFNRSANW